jgi:PAS domain S-box-containing protein
VSATPSVPELDAAIPRADSEIADAYPPAHTGPVRPRYRMALPSAVALAVAIPLVIVIVMWLGETPVRRDLGLLAGVALVTFLAWAGGIWPGLISTLLFAVLFSGPLGPAHFDPPLDSLSVFSFAVAGLVATTIVESQYRAQWRVETARDRARISRRAEHAMRGELESIVGAIGDGIMVVEADGRVSLMNRAATDLLGHRVDVFDDLLTEIVPPESAHAHQRNGDTAVTTEFQFIDQERRMEMSSFPLVTDGEATRRVAVLRDVTEARRRDLLRDAFLSLLSHELRTPMTAVYGGATLLQRVGDKLDPATRNDVRADIVSEAERLSRLIDDLLVLTRVEGGVEVGHEPALLQHLVAEVANQDIRGVKGRPIEVVADPGLPPVMGDETSIRQVTHNLISNALKYSPIGSPVEIRVQGGDGEVLVRVLDRGRGMSDEEAVHVFEPFYRGSDSALVSGVGIGLFVCQRLVEAMGGRIWTRRRDGGGSEFGFALSLFPIEADDEENYAPADRAGASS